MVALGLSEARIAKLNGKSLAFCAKKESESAESLPAALRFAVLLRASPE